MNDLIKKIAVSAGIFLGAVLIMCLAAKIMINNDNAEGDVTYSEAIDKLAGDTAPAGEDIKQNGDVSAAGDEKAGQSSENDNGSKDMDKDTDKNTDRNTDKGGAGTQPQTGSTDKDGNDKSGGNISSDDGTSEQDPGDKGTTEDSTVSGNSKYTVAIDAAHQSEEILEKEPLGPGSEEMKYKVTAGATGISTHTSEYKLNLAIALALKEELIKRGYDVYMIRENNDVNISDSERAVLANGNADIVIHIHANSDEREHIRGIMAFYPSAANKYSGALSDSCKKLGSSLLTGLEDATGASSWGMIANDNLTALNWTEIPASHVEVGYLSNAEEDELLQSDDYRAEIVEGLADGVDLYYGR